MALAKESILYSFNGAPDGELPWGDLVQDRHGNFFGTTNLGGTGSCSSGCGTVFELSPAGRGRWSESVLHSFQGGSDGSAPNSALVMDAHGNLYGVTAEGGTGDCSNENLTGCGTVFELSPQGGGAWNETVLYSFQGVAAGQNTGDAAWPNAIVFGPSGQIFGTAYDGVVCTPVPNCGGGVFELTKHHGAWRESLIYEGDATAFGPTGMLFDAKGNIYSVSSGGGPENLGEVFMLTPPSGKGQWTKTDIYDFQNQNDGALPVAGLALDAAGNLYGASDGTDSVYANIFELTPGKNGTWTESVVISFTDLDYGYYPYEGPILDTGGNLFGTTSIAGASNNGLVYRVSPGKGGWVGKVLHEFESGGDGSQPLAGVRIGKDGALYGTTGYGGTGACTDGCGTVFRLRP